MTTIVENELVSAAKINQWAPPGAVIDYAGATAPDGWFICDGSAINRTTYADLFAAIGTTYGAGDGSTTFNLPDARGRMIVAKGTHTDVSTLGNNDGITVANRRPKHRTSISDPGHVHSGVLVGGASVNSPGGTVTNAPGNTGSSTTGITVGTNNPNDALDTPAYLVLNKIIRAKDV